jgi:co-chaperonin GroES (HSP10)
MDIYRPESVFNNPNLLPFELVNPNCLLLLEYKREEMSKGGILLLDISANLFGQSHRLPKWKVLKVGNNVEGDIGIKVGDMVIVHPKAGKLHMLTGKVECRLIKSTEVLGKVIHEPKDVVVPRALDSNLNWSKI